MVEANAFRRVCGIGRKDLSYLTQRFYYAFSIRNIQASVKGRPLLVFLFALDNSFPHGT